MIAIIKYNAGNVASVKNAVDRIGYQSIITDDRETILQAEKVILPGVGEASSAMKHLNSSGLSDIIVQLKQPVLGICLGQHLLCRYSEEGNASCLGVFDVLVRKFPPTDIVPHMGWNNIEFMETPIFNGLDKSLNMYFVHSYYCELSPFSIATCQYILPFCAAMQKDNFYATQFHPEKSGKYGQTILSNFLNLKTREI